MIRMKAKNHQGPITSESDAKEKLIVYVYEYLTHSGAKRAAQAFIEDIDYRKDIQFNSVDGPGFLANWWCVFWDLYCAAPEKRNQPEPTSEARAFHELNMRPSNMMSPQTSPPQQPHGGPSFMGGPGGPRYGPPLMHSGGPLRGAGLPPMNIGPPRMQGVPQPMMSHHQMGPNPHGPPPPPPQQMMGGAGSPRYAPHPGQMTPGSSASSIGPVGPEPGPSPGLGNRMTPNHSSSPHPQAGGIPPMGSHQMSQGVPPPPPMQRVGGPGMPPQQQQPGGGNNAPGGGGGGGAGGGGGGNWQGNFSVNSPADQQCFMPGPPVQSNQQGSNDFGGNMMMSEGPGMMYVKSAPPNSNQAPPQNQQQDEYVMPGAYGQNTDQSDAGSEILKLKESLESNTNDGEQSGFDMEFPESQGEWQH